MDQTEDQPKDQLQEFIELEKAKIVGETAKAPWKELERFYAQGILILVDNSLDLVEVGFAISSDNTKTINQWMESSLLVRQFDQQAIEWANENADLWTVVIRPWVLIQALQTKGYIPSFIIVSRLLKSPSHLVFLQIFVKRLTSSIKVVPEYSLFIYRRNKPVNNHAI